MQTVHDIFEIAGTFAAELTQTQKTALYRLCQAAGAELEGQLRKGVGVTDCYEAFVCAGAYLALSRFYAAVGDGVGSLEAGNLKLTREAPEKVAARLAEAAQQLLAPYLDDGGFAFRGVRT